MKFSPALKFILLTFFMLILFLAGLSLGSQQTSLTDIVAVFFSTHLVDSGVISIIKEIRLPRTLGAMIAGAGLSVAGLMMQSLFRNPLAGPSVLGISSGASLGVAFAVLGGFTVGVSSFISNFNLFFFAVLGATAVVFLIVAISLRLKDNSSLLIAGLMIGYFVSAIVSILQSNAGQGQLQAYIFWGFAGFGGITSAEIPYFGLTVIAPLVFGVSLMKPLNVLLMGEEYAISLGTNIKRVRMTTIIACGVLVGAITAWCGPIAFIGIAIPHFARAFFKTTDHRILFPACIFIGMAATLVCDIASRAPWGGNPLPLNAITSMLGAPVIVWYIFKRSRMSQLF
jgi:iron complex transport system permease protein